MDAASPHYLALNDSYTIGEDVPAEGTWPYQLAAALRARGIALDDPQVIVIICCTIDELAAAIDVAAPQGPYALASLLIGVNNQYRGRPLAEYRQQFEQLLQRAIAFAGEDAQRVLVLSIPDWGVSPFAGEHGRDAARAQRGGQLGRPGAFGRHAFADGVGVAQRKVAG